MRALPPVEQFLASHRGQYLASEEAWIRRHPDYVTDPQFQARIIEEHNRAMGDGFRRGTSAYVARMDRVAAEFGGGGANYGPAPMLSGVALDTARATYQAVHPEKNAGDPVEISRWWHEQRHSPSAYRIRESWLTRDDDTGRW